MTDLACRRGDTERYTIPIVDENDAVVDITSGVIRFTVKVRKTDPDTWALIQKSTGAGITHTDPTNGIAVVTVQPADTRNIQADGDLYWDAQLEAGGDVVTIDSGTFTLSTDITLTTA